MLELNASKFYAYDPAETVINELAWPLEEKEKLLLSELTPFQKTLLELRRVGITVQQIADHMGCGFSKVRKQISEAKQKASSIFNCNYGRTNK